MSLKEIASAAGVSVGTVSKAFSDSREISEQTKERIFRAAKELGELDKYAKSERFHRLVVAVCCPEMCSEYYISILSGIQTALERRNVLPVFSFCGFHSSDATEHFRLHAYYHKVDGMIMVSNDEIETEVDKSFPVVFLKPDSGKERRKNHLLIDYASGMDDAFSHLLENGHREIAYIGERLTDSKNSIFLQIAKKRGFAVRDDWFYISNKRFYDAGREGMDAFLSCGALPTAVFCAYDYIAFGAMNRAREMGLSVPEDISFIGMDNIATDDMIDTPLSSVSLLAENVYDEIVDSLLKKIDNKSLASTLGARIRTGLVKRKSVLNLHNHSQNKK